MAIRRWKLLKPHFSNYFPAMVYEFCESRNCDKTSGPVICRGILQDKVGSRVQKVNLGVSKSAESEFGCVCFVDKR